MQNNSEAFIDQCVANATSVWAAYLEDPELRRELTPGRRSWKRDRDDTDFYSTMINVWPEEGSENENYMKHFRMSKRTFEYILMEIGPHITKCETRMRSRAKKGGSDVVPPRAKLAITLQYLATGCSQCSLESTWGWARSTISGIIKDTVGAMRNFLVKGNIKVPQGEELINVIQSFKAAGLPCCAGAIDGCYLPIRCPSQIHGHQYYCYKKYHAILLMTVCDSRGIIMSVDVGHPGQVGDADTFERSRLRRYILRGTALNRRYGESIDGEHVSPYLIGDGAFRLEMHMMKGYPDLTPAVGSKEWHFNNTMVTCRGHIEDVFGRLTARWQILKSRRVTDLRYFNVVIAVCCALHNICERSGDQYDDSIEELHTTTPNSTARAQVDTQNATLIRQHERRLNERMIALDDAPPGRDAKILRDKLAERLQRIAELG